ncbi:MAG: DUF1302 domain-containing protein [Pseudomonadales bacterium]|nr:DUF1302 domain-containing protein [Pseudomonadales bacterium]
MGTKLTTSRSPIPLSINLLTTALAMAASINVSAYQFDNGDLQLSFDSTLSIGAGWRIEERNKQNLGPARVTSAEAAAGLVHKHATSAQDNSNMLFDRSTYSKIIKGSHELEINYLNYGAFIRGRYFYDVELMDEGRVSQGSLEAPDPEPTKAALDKAGATAEFLDVFVWGNWEIDDHFISARLGRQVISWGEGIFFPHGINAINPVSLSALRAPGAELKEAFIPIDALYGSFDITANVTLEAFVQFNWKETEIDPCGTMFSTTDIVGPGCSGGFYAFGGEPGQITTILVPAENLLLPRSEDLEPDDSGQFGFAVRYYAEQLQTEFAAYYLNFHSRLPIVSGTMPLEDGLGEPLTDLNASLLSVLPLASYKIEYPEDIKLIGFSFNTSIDLGILGGATAISGEISMRQDQPFQIEDSVLVTGVAGLDSQICSRERVPDIGVEFDCHTRTDVGQGEFLSGAIREDFYQAELAFIHFFDRILGSDRWTIILDMAYARADIPNKEDLLLNSGYNTDTSPFWGPLATTTGEQNFYPEKSSWGYKMKFIGSYSNVFAGINLEPSITYSHDVNGVTPGPAANFLEGRKKLSMDLTGHYLNQFSANIGYTRFYGSAPYNLMNDRDFITLSASTFF